MAGLTEAYKARVIAHLRQYVEGVETFALRKLFPRVPLRDMEKEGTIWCDCQYHWHAAKSKESP